MNEQLNPVDPKDPSDIKTYTMDWSGDLLDGATLTGSTWDIQPTGLTKVSDGIVSGNLKSSLTVSGGVAGTTYECTNQVTTSAGETLNRTGEIKVMER